MTRNNDVAAIDAVLGELKTSASPGHFNAIRQAGTRLKGFLSEQGITLRQMIDGDLGEAEVCGGPDAAASSRDQYKGALRAILDKLCENCVLELAYGRCVVPADGMSPHRDTRGLLGYPEAVGGIYPAWLIPERFRRGIKHNASVPAKIKREFQEFAAQIRRDAEDEGGINEKTLTCYWENIRDLALSGRLNSLHDLEGVAGVEKLQGIIDARPSFTGKTSTVNHWRRVLNKVLGNQSPFRAKNEEGDFSLRLRKAGKRVVVAEGKRFRKRGKLFEVIDGEMRGCCITFRELRHLVHFDNKRTKGWRKAAPVVFEDIFRQAQEDALVKVCCLIKDRPAERWAHNWMDWKLFRAEPYDSEGRLYDGDGLIYNNFRDSSKKIRPDKPFPKWLAFHLERGLWPIRRAHFARRGDCDQRATQETGILRSGAPMFVDPRTGRRATTGQLLEWLRRGLIRAGMSEILAARVSGYWFRRGVITSERANAALDEAVATTGGQSVATMKHNYLYDEAPLRVAEERKNLWIPLGIVAAGPSGDESVPIGLSTEGLKEMAKRIAVKMSARDPQAVPLCEAELDEIAESLIFRQEARVSDKDAALLLGVSASTLRRWAALGFFKRYREGGRVFFLKRELEAFKNSFTLVSPAAKLLGCSDSYLRRLCRLGRIKGARRVGAKSYLIPWFEVRSLAAKKGARAGKRKAEKAVQNRNLMSPKFGTCFPENPLLA